MGPEHSGLVPVDTGLVLETLVGRMSGLVEGRRADGPGEALAALLAAADLRLTGSRPELEAELGHAGYLARMVELELFEPARQPAEWLRTALAARAEEAGGRDEATTGLCSELARSEPLGKPDPDDEAAVSWRVPGPGGHVRHFLARRTIEEQLSGAEAPVEDPAELKRPWLYGFLLRACEESPPPPGAAPDEGS